MSDHIERPAEQALVLPSLAKICASPELLEALDVGALNLMCAGGLPGAENLDMGRMLDWLDEVAHAVDLEIRRHLNRFMLCPATFHNSLGYFSCYYMLQTLQEAFNVCYNPVRISDPKFQDTKCFDPDFRDSRDLFIHGIIDGPGGTCASMPVLYVAVGRRLGFPLRLVEARGHLFFRWDDPTGECFNVPERFNIEGTGYGIGSEPDEHYAQWPEPFTEADKAGGWYLKSLSRIEEFASFLATRGECLLDNGRIEEARQAWVWACGLVDDLRYKSRLAEITRRVSFDVDRYLADIEARRPKLPTPISAAFLQTPSVATPSGHAQFCQCRDCVEARTINEAREAVAQHGGHCQCAHCREAQRRLDEASGPKHWAGCPCADCRKRKSVGVW